MNMLSIDKTTVPSMAAVAERLLRLARDRSEPPVSPAVLGEEPEAKEVDPSMARRVPDRPRRRLPAGLALRRPQSRNRRRRQRRLSKIRPCRPRVGAAWRRGFLVALIGIGIFVTDLLRPIAGSIRQPARACPARPYPLVQASYAPDTEGILAEAARNRAAAGSSTETLAANQYRTSSQAPSPTTAPTVRGSRPRRSSGGRSPATTR